MAKKQLIKSIGILTAGGDCPGLNAAIRAVAKSALHYGIKVTGIMDGFRGLVENRTIPLTDKEVSGILTNGGTILGTSRDKPHKMKMGGKVMDMTNVALANAEKQQIDCLVCLGGNGTQKNALHLHKAGGLNVMTLPKTIDNDIAETDICFGFDTAVCIATEAIDRLHSTATSHNRIMVCELMGHDAGWLTLAAGIAGGADVIMIPEIPYDLNIVADHLIERRHSGKRFSIIAVAEGVKSIDDIKNEAAQKSEKKNKKSDSSNTHANSSTYVDMVEEPKVRQIARQLQTMTGIDARVTSLGHVQRGGTPSGTDRLLCTRLGTRAGQLLAQGTTNVMVAVKGSKAAPVPLEKVAGIKKIVPVDHPWIATAQLVETCMGTVL